LREADAVADEAAGLSAADVDPHELRPEAVLGLVHAGDEHDDGAAVRGDLRLGEPDHAGEVLETEASRLAGRGRRRQHRGHDQCHPTFSHGTSRAGSWGRVYANPARGA
jgi:hypothetical protein